MEKGATERGERPKEEIHVKQVKHKTVSVDMLHVCTKESIS